MEKLLHDIRACQICEKFLDPRPILSACENSKILIIGQAPGIRVHNSGIAWDDPSGDNLRSWMGVSKEQFYDTDNFAIIPMGFCYPGKEKCSDLPPRKECAPLWHTPLFAALKNVKLTLLIGQYAQNYYLKNTKKSNLTETVLHFEEYLPEFFTLPHPSPRNFIWQTKNKWFEKNALPQLKSIVQKILNEAP